MLNQKTITNTPTFNDRQMNLVVFQQSQEFLATLCEGKRVGSKALTKFIFCTTVTKQYTSTNWRLGLCWANKERRVTHVLSWRIWNWDNASQGIDHKTQMLWVHTKKYTAKKCTHCISYSGEVRSWSRGHFSMNVN